MSPRLRDILQIVLVHRRKSLTVLILASAVTWVALAAWPRTYRSEAVLLVRVGRESIALDPTTTISQTLMLQKSQQDEVNSALNILNSYQVAAAAVDAIGPRRILENQPLATTPSTTPPTALESGISWLRDRIDDAMWSAKLKDPVGDRELAILRVQNSLSASAPKNSTVISIEGTGESPALAQLIVDEVVKAFLSQRLASSKTTGSREFFDEQVAKLDRRLAAKAQELAAFRQANQIISITSNRSVLKEQISRVEQQLSAAESQLRQIEAEAAELHEAFATIAPEIVQAKTAQTDATWSGMRQALYELQIQEKKLNQVVTADHPKLQALQAQVKQAQSILAEQTQEAVDRTTTPNPIWEHLAEQLTTIQASLVGVESKVVALKAQRTSLQAALRKQVANETKLVKMERDYDLLEADYKQIAAKQQEARVIEQLRTDRISNVNIVQPATFVERPVSPKKKIIGAFGLLMSLGGAVFTALAAEATRATMRTSEHAESKLGVPVLVSIPESKRIRTARDVAALNAEYHDVKAGCRSVLRQLYAGVNHAHTPPKTIGILSCNSGAGASTMASLLAFVAGDDFGLNAVLVDADDRRRPARPQALPAAELSDAVVDEDHFKKLGADGFDDDGFDDDGFDDDDFGNDEYDECIDEELEGDADDEGDEINWARASTAHADSDNPIVQNVAGPAVVDARFVNPQAVFSEVRRLALTHDLIIVDLPAATSGGGAALASMLDCVVLIVEADVTDARAAQRVLAQLERSHARLEGIILNKSKQFGAPRARPANRRKRRDRR